MSFHVSCGFSNISIEEGDKVRFIPLTFNHKDKFPTNLLSIGNMFKPLFFAIKGEYNGYGSITNIVLDKNTELIESFTGLSINEFVYLVKDESILSSKPNKEVLNILKNMTGMFVLEDIYQDFILKQRKSLKKSENEWEMFKEYINKIKKIIDNFEKAGLNDMIRYQLEQSNVISPLNQYVFLYEYLPHIEELKDFILEEFLVYEFMIDFNISYKPTYHGLQYSDYKKVIKFEKFKTNLLKNKLKEKDE